MEALLCQALQQLTPVDQMDCALSLRKDFGIDSLALVNLMILLEESFQITLDVSDLNPDQFQTVQDLVVLIQKYVEIE